MKRITTPITKAICESLKVGDVVYLSGTIYTARDAAHQRLCEMIKQKQPLPFPLQDATIYYVGPTPTPKGKIFGSAGPTTSSRMDFAAPMLYDFGVSATIGKGYRSLAVEEAIIRNHKVYFVAIGGAGALLGKCVKKAEIIAFEELGTEAIQRLEVEDFPISVAIDWQGGNLYE